MKELTDRQQLVYDFVKSEISRGMPPTVREICEALDMPNPQGVQGHLEAIEAKGHITREPSTARGIRLVGQTGKCPTCGRRVRK